MKKIRDEIKEAALLFVQDGGTRKQACEKFGVSEATLRYWLDPEQRRAHIESSALWCKNHPDKMAEYCRKYRDNMTDEQRSAYAERQRFRYATEPAFREKFRVLAQRYRLDAQYVIAMKLRQAVLGWSGRHPVLFGPMMRAITGMRQEEFTERFRGDGEFDHIVPLSAFDLTNPYHVVRANHPSNLQLLPPHLNQRKHDAIPAGLDILSLKWSRRPDAAVQAASFISRQLANLSRRVKSAKQAQPTQEESCQ